MGAWIWQACFFPAGCWYITRRKRNIHAVVNYLETLAPLGIHAADPHLELIPGAEDRAFALQLLSSQKSGARPLIALNPGASHEVNRWGTEHFAALADMLAQKLDARVIIVGGPGDVTLAEEIAARPVQTSSPHRKAATGSFMEHYCW
jgi:ADP-heptose:LPS heptosyltransferase